MTETLASADGVTKRFGDDVAVACVDLDVGRGEVVGLLGANGAGKTTLLRMLLGLLPVDGGRVTLLGGTPSRAARLRLGYVPQGTGLYDDLTVAENLAFVARSFGSHAAPLDDDLSAVRDTLVRDVSLGIKRRVAFAAALSHDPSLLVLDEPTSGVGPLARAALWETVRGVADDGAGVLVTTHHMDEAEQCDRLVVMSAGRTVATGTVESITSGIATVAFRPRDRIAALDRLEQAGLPALPHGSSLRVPGADVETVVATVGEATAESGFTEEQATLDEAFVVLSRR